MHEVVQDYYGQKLTGTQDLKTSVCCDATLIPNWVKPLLANIHEEVLSRYYGCGLVSVRQSSKAVVFETGEVFPVSGNTWKILAESRFAPHFEFIGDFSCHYGIFEGDGSSLPFATTSSQSNSNACC